ncbi:MAG: hypothetical protein ABI442_20710 [Gemmatimonadaceae bacterium]
MPKAHTAAGADSPDRTAQAESVLAHALAAAGWRVRALPDNGSAKQPDMVARRRGAAYSIELKATSEGRSDRLIPLWSQACLRAVQLADDSHAPLAVIAAPRIPHRVAEHVLAFATEFAPHVAVGVIDFEGLRMFRGPYLEDLNSDSAHTPSSPSAGPSSSAIDLFSDLNQWMLKVLLAPELPDNMLSAPRDDYKNASELARAASVSVMSASRFVTQLHDHGYLDSSARYLSVVRREDLFRRWQAAGARPTRELALRFLLRGDPAVEFHRILRTDKTCLALFAAAAELGIGFVRGVPAYVYVDRLSSAKIASWKNVAAAGPGESPDLIVRQAPAVKSVFRGMVRVHDLPVCDVLQIWLDVSPHPSRGHEQAEVIERHLLDSVIHRRVGNSER